MSFFRKPRTEKSDCAKLYDLVVSISKEYLDSFSNSQHKNLETVRDKTLKVGGYTSENLQGENLLDPNKKNKMTDDQLTIMQINMSKAMSIRTIYGTIGQYLYKYNDHTKENEPGDPKLMINGIKELVKNYIQMNNDVKSVNGKIVHEDGKFEENLNHLWKTITTIENYYNLNPKMTFDKAMLLLEIDTKLEDIEKRMNQNPSSKNLTSLKEKREVAEAVKLYTLGGMKIDSLRKVIKEFPEYDAGNLIRSDTGKLLDRALKLKNDSLSPKPESEHRSNMRPQK